MLVRSLDAVPKAAHGGAVSIGNFDGVHRGHAAIIASLCTMARRWNGPTVVFTFDPHPLSLLAPQAAPIPLTWPERKADLLSQLGVEFIVSYPTDLDLLSLEPEAFFERVLVGALSARGMVEGADFRFGQGRRGDRRLLEWLCQRHGVELEIEPAVEHGGEIVSSSRVRRLIGSGDVEAANELLVAPYRIRGLVVEGARRGRELGFPTANLEQIPNLVPSVGVYAGRGWCGDESWKAAVHIGPNPTFGEGGRKVEVHLLDCERDLYGATLEIEFARRLRDVVAFDSVQDLQRQLQIDIASTREAVAE